MKIVSVEHLADKVRDDRVVLEIVVFNEIGVCAVTLNDGLDWLARRAKSDLFITSTRPLLPQTMISFSVKFLLASVRSGMTAAEARLAAKRSEMKLETNILNMSE